MKELNSLKSALCSIKSGLPVLIHDNNSEAIIVQSSADLVHSSYLLVTAEKILFNTGNQIGDRKIKIENVSEIDVKNLIEVNELDRLAIRLAKKAEVQPDLFVTEKASCDELLSFDGNILKISSETILNYIDYEEIKKVSEAELHLEGEVTCRFLVYQSTFKESYAIIIGDQKNFKNPLVRIHSSCYTGDLLGSLSCDCRSQLHSAIHHINSDSDGGIIVYLMQEGRGIGLANKIKTYKLQREQALDTLQANLALGFKDDERDFTVAWLILKDLGVKNIRLITNNPRKIQDLEKHGIHITDRVRLKIFKNEYNAKYLETKFEKLGHIQ